MQQEYLKTNWFTKTISVMFMAAIVLTIIIAPVGIVDIRAAVFGEYEPYDPTGDAAGDAWVSASAAGFDGNLYSFRLVCVDNRLALAVISDGPGSEFFATSANMIDWEIRGPSAGWYVYRNGWFYWYIYGLHRSSDWRDCWQLCIECYLAPPYSSADWCHDYELTDYELADSDLYLDLCTALVQQYFYDIRPLTDAALSLAGINRIERVPYLVDGEILWVGYVVFGSTTGNAQRHQIRIYADGERVNPVPRNAAPAWLGVDEISWGIDAANFVANRGLMNMYKCGYTMAYIHFNPRGRATRGDVLAAAIKALGLSAPGFADSDFTPFYDVPLYGRGIYINTARELGLVDGIGNNLFAPDRTITRQDMMTMLYNILLAQGQITPDMELVSLRRFRDAGQIAPYARLPIASLARAGIIAGSGININPREYMTRIEAAMFVWNLYRMNNPG